MKDRFNIRGSGQRRPGPHQRRAEKTSHEQPAAATKKGGEGGRRSPAKAAHAAGPRKEARQGRAPQGRAPQGRAPQGRAPQGRAGQGPPHAAREHKRVARPGVEPTAGDDGEATVIVQSHGLARLQAGHTWVYQSDCSAHPALEGGAAVRVTDERGFFLGKALYGKESQIALRLVSREDVAIDEAFFEERLRAAIGLRERFRPDPERRFATRLVHGEADGLPGLVVDRYGHFLAIQTLTEAAERRQELIAGLLEKLLQPRAIVLRNDVKIRAHEGLEQEKKVLRGELPGPVDYFEGEVLLQADLLEGQKTGAFLDQSENHLEAGRYAQGRALDVFSYSGGFALQLLRRADSVLAIDQSEKALAAAQAAALKASPELAAKLSVKAVNAFDFLKDQVDDGEKYDTIVLDPPAFAKARGTLEPALRGYKEVNLRALQLLSPGGTLVTCSCSFHVDDALFEKTVLSAAADAQRTVQVVERRGAGRDHPTLLGVPETRYLKCLILRAL
jgi:23S rRNA (cytosine1962-C5)-methyltransferase